jgi:cephalosporin hydroxylase
MCRRLKLIQGSSVDPAIVASIQALASKRKRVLVVLDSNHTHAHVLDELKSYGPMVTRGSYLVVFDTIIEEMPPEFSKDRPWGKGNNARTAVQEYLKTTDRFLVDREIDSKLQITAAPGGYLACVKD